MTKMQFSSVNPNPCVSLRHHLELTTWISRNAASLCRRLSRTEIPPESPAPGTQRHAPDSPGSTGSTRSCGLTLFGFSVRSYRLFLQLLKHSTTITSRFSPFFEKRAKKTTRTHSHCFRRLALLHYCQWSSISPTANGRRVGALGHSAKKNMSDARRRCTIPANNSRHLHSGSKAGENLKIKVVFSER